MSGYSSNCALTAISLIIHNKNHHLNKWCVTQDWIQRSKKKSKLERIIHNAEIIHNFTVIHNYTQNIYNIIYKNMYVYTILSIICNNTIYNTTKYPQKTIYTKCIFQNI